MKEKKESLHVVYVLTKLELGGAQKVCLSLLQGIQEAQSASLISGNQGVLTEQAKKFDHVFLLDSFKREVSLFSLFAEMKNFFAITVIIKNLKKKYPNIVVHTHSTKAGLIGRWAAFFAGVKKRVHTVHGYGFHERQSKIRWLVIYLLELITSFITTSFVCVSHKDRSTGTKLFPRFARKSTIIRAAVDWNSFIIPGKKTSYNHEKIFTIGTISCLKPQKNIIDLLKAFNYALTHLSEKNIQLEIIGDGEQRTLIEKFIKTHNLSQHVTLHGWQKNVAPILRTWNIFSLSSLWEGLPCAVIEARLQHLPVVAYNVGGISEVITSGENGFLINPGEWKTLGEKLAQIAQDPSLFNSLASHRENLNDFKNDTMIAKHLNLYHSLL